jgi:hypothetical protein
LAGYPQAAPAKEPNYAPVNTPAVTAHAPSVDQYQPPGK